MSSLKDKMYNYEVTPPANSWEKIATVLDGSELQNKFPSRLYNIEVAPPAGAWERVSESIEPKTGPLATVRKLTPIFRYAAAAIFIAAVAYGIVNLTTRTNSSENTEMATIAKDTNIVEKAKPAEPEKNKTIKPSIASGDEELIRPDKTVIAKSDRLTKKPRRAITSAVLETNDEIDTNLSQSLYAYGDYIPDIADRYVMLMTPDGNIIRMAKKWSNLLCCVSGEEQDPDCKSQLKKWQEKLATSPLAPSPGNFMDILGLVNSLNDNNGL